MTAHTRRRSGFTLLELLLASAIAVLLLGALYTAFDVTLRQTQDGRDAVDADNLSRAVFNRLSLDLTSSLAPLPPKSGGTPPESVNPSADTSTADTTTTTTTTTTSGATTTAGSTTGSGTTTTEDEPATDPAGNYPFQGGVIGDAGTLTVFCSRTPADLADANAFLAGPSADRQATSDLRRVTYWLSSSGKGLCRQERPWVTADGVGNSTTPDLSDEAGDVVADEVTAVEFEYFDGTAWVESWDGSAVGSDGVIPIGPPRAVRITLTLEIPATRPGLPPVVKSVQQVVAVRTAPGTAAPVPVEVPDDTTTDTTGGTTTTGGTP